MPRLTCAGACERAHNAIPVIFDFVWDAVRSRALAVIIVLGLVDLLYLQGLLGLPACSSTLKGLNGGSGGGNVTLSTLADPAPSLSPSSFIDVSAFIVAPGDRVGAMRWAALVTAAVANARYQHELLLVPAAALQVAYVIMSGVVEMPACDALADIAMQLQDAQNAASSAGAAGNNGTDFAFVFPLSLTASLLWLIVMQRALLWAFAAVAALILVAMVPRPVAAAARYWCQRAKPAAAGAADAPSADTTTANPLRRLASGGSDGVAPAAIPAVNRLTLPARLEQVMDSLGVAVMRLRALPQRLLIALVITFVVIIVMTAAFVAPLATLASWSTLLLREPAALRSFAEEIAAEIDPSGSTQSLVDTVLRLTSFGVQAIAALAISLLVGLGVACVVCVVQLVRSVIIYAELAALYRARGSHHSVATTAAAPPAAVATPEPSSIGGRSRPPPCCAGVIAAVRSSLAPLWSWDRPYGVSHSGRIDFDAFSFYGAFTLVPFIVVNVTTSFFALYALTTIAVFLIAFEPSRAFLLARVLSTTTIITIITLLLKRLVLDCWLTDGRNIRWPRLFATLDLAYSTTVGFATGLANALLRVVLGAAWSALRCMQLHEPLLGGPAAMLDSGWMVHGATLKCAYAAGPPPAKFEDSAPDGDSGDAAVAGAR